MNIDKEKKELIEKILREIADDLIERYEKNELEADIGLFSGKTGISLFLFYYSRYMKEERYEEYAQKFLESVFDDINNGNLMPTYCSGLAGVGWTVDHLVEEGFIGRENLQILGEFDKYLYVAMKNYISENNFDFLHGSTGIAYYFTKRAEKVNETIEYLEYYVDKLYKYAIFDDENNTAKMISSIIDSNETTKKVYNLSLSHGMSSVVVVLSKIYYLIGDKNFCYDLIRGLVEYIFSCEKTMHTVSYSIYPSYVEVEGEKNETYGRLAWCYGDIGPCYAYLYSYRILHDCKLLSKAQEIIDLLRQKKDISVQSIRDAGLCHGSAGILMVCSNLDSKVERSLIGLKKYWLDITLDFYKRSKGIKGFSMATPTEPEFVTTLLCGTSGIAIELLNYVCNLGDVLCDIFLLKEN